MHAISTWIRTRTVDPISYDDNRYTKRVVFNFDIYLINKAGDNFHKKCVDA